MEDKKQITIEEIDDLLDISEDDTIFDKIYFFFYNIYRNWLRPIVYWYRLKRLCVFITKGFDPKDTWNLDISIAKYTLPRLTYLRDNLQGCPMGIADNLELQDTFNDDNVYHITNVYKADTENYEFALWNHALNLMIEAFQLIVDGEDNMETYEKIDFGIKMFGKYFRNLWD